MIFLNFCFESTYALSRIDVPKSEEQSFLAFWMEFLWIIDTICNCDSCNLFLWMKEYGSVESALGRMAVALSALIVFRIIEDCCITWPISKLLILYMKVSRYQNGTKVSCLRYINLRVSLSLNSVSEYVSSLYIYASSNKEHQLFSFFHSITCLHYLLMAELWGRMALFKCMALTVVLLVLICRFRC